MPLELSRPIPYEPIWWEENKALNVPNLDTMDYGILNSFFQSQAHWLVDGSEEIIVYDGGGNISQVQLEVDSVLRRRITLNYTGDNISSIDVKIYKENGTTIFIHYVDALTYSSGNLTKVTRTVHVFPTTG